MRGNIISSTIFFLHRTECGFMALVIYNFLLVATIGYFIVLYGKTLHGNTSRMKKGRVSAIKPLSLKSTEKNVKNVKKCNHQNDFLGLPRLFDRSYSPSYKIVWFAIVVTCCSGCSYQIAQRVNLYLEGPITLEVKLKPQTSFTFPSVTLCNTNIISMIATSWKTNTIQDINFTDTSHLWSEFSGIKEKDMTVKSMCYSKHCTTPIKEVMNIAYVNMLAGRCIILTAKTQTEYIGPRTYIQINWNTSNSKTYTRNEEYNFLVHDDALKHSYDGLLKAEDAVYGCQSQFRIFAKELLNLNTKRNPCVSAEEANFCLNKCVDKEIMNVSYCGLPILNSRTLKQCTNWTDLLHTYTRIYPIIFNMSHHFEACQCKRKCREIKYTLHKDGERPSVDNNTVLWLLYADDTHESVTEREIFTPTALFSDIGGTLCLHLGISLFAIVDFFQSIIRRF